MITCFLGAGFSFVCGLPLAKDLFKSRRIRFKNNKYERFKQVWSSYDHWEIINPKLNSEEFLLELYNDIFQHEAKFEYAVELLASVLATPVDRDINYFNPQYSSRLDSPLNCAIHSSFWQFITKKYFDIKVITTNYDLFIERTLRHKKMTRVFGTGFYYGGFEKPQLLKGSSQPFSIKNRSNKIELVDGIEICKLHGSLNWALLKNDKIEMYLDMRPAYRNKCDAAIIPPLPEKIIPSWLSNVWEKAELHLRNSADWIICGYSFPEYDDAVHELIRRTLDSQNVYILDPNSYKIMERLKSISGDAKFYPLSGLPEGVEELKRISN